MVRQLVIRRIVKNMLAGLPARTTESMWIRMWNTVNGGSQKTFAYGAMLFFVTLYHKDFRRTGQVKLIHRCLPREVSELLIWYF